MPTIEISIQTQEKKLHIYKQLYIISLMTVYDRSGANWQWFQVHIENFYTGIVTALGLEILVKTLLLSLRYHRRKLVFSLKLRKRESYAC